MTCAGCRQPFPTLSARHLCDGCERSLEALKAERVSKRGATKP